MKEGAVEFQLEFRLHSLQLELKSRLPEGSDDQNSDEESR